MNWIKRLLKVLGVISLACLFFLLLVYKNDIPYEAIEQKYSTPESHFVEVDGINVHVRIKGRGEPIILLHGSFSSLHTWNDWQNELSPFFLTVSLDFPGHGLTGPDLEKRYSVRDYAILVTRLAEKLNLDKFHLAGNSMGGAVALQIASNRPDQVLSLNLIDAAGTPLEASALPKGSSSPKKRWMNRMADNPFFTQILLKCTPKFLFSMNMKEVYAEPDKLTKEQVDRYYELMLRAGNRQATLERLATPADAKIDFGRLDMPTLILWGEEDTWIPVSRAYLLEKLIPGSKLKILKNAGHLPMEEIPTESVAEYLNFLGVEVRKDYFEPPKLISYVD
ncbi:alpha/beta fold hydrolase [Algoriphagus halophytocola]|uniref:Alpha/beta hydrolase n=1 Tax=Algoriphagus halophytocola TaxID=2991499 RepID=A0ABY6MJ02_9BACT|nr:alpha/beta hydrolase [Algoriphagus sp. TR-M5]UZD23762.1 alpha/beta hydrolase [Algoriphagus sp. TR-M5]